MLTTIAQPTQLLYHGTAERNSKSIEKKGLLPATNNVYLTSDIQAAYEYARRAVQGSDTLPVICIVDAPQMYKDGFVFYSENNTEYATQRVPSKYILQLGIENESELSFVQMYADAAMTMNMLG